MKKKAAIKFYGIKKISKTQLLETNWLSVRWPTHRAAPHDSERIEVQTEKIWAALTLPVLIIITTWKRSASSFIEADVLLNSYKEPWNTSKWVGPESPTGVPPPSWSQSERTSQPRQRSARLLCDRGSWTPPSRSSTGTVVWLSTHCVRRTWTAHVCRPPGRTEPADRSTSYIPTEIFVKTNWFIYRVIFLTVPPKFQY